MVEPLVLGRGRRDSAAKDRVETREGIGGDGERLEEGRLAAKDGVDGCSGALGAQDTLTGNVGLLALLGDGGGVGVEGLALLSLGEGDGRGGEGADWEDAVRC